MLTLLSLLSRAAVAALILVMSLVSTVAWAQTLTVVSFNVESDRDTDPRKVAEDIAAISTSASVDLFGLAEVQNEADANVFQKAADRDGAGFRYLLAKNGNEDRVAILYNQDALTFREVLELDRFPGSRKALVARFQHKAAGVEFLFMVNHFNRGDIRRRQRQASLIRDWVLNQPLPVVLAGDYNFDFDPKEGRGNSAYEIFVANRGIVWLQPECVAAGSCPATGTQCDSRYNSISDFIFLADKQRGWRGFSKILAQQPNYCERERRGYSDHRPVLGLIDIQ